MFGTDIHALILLYVGTVIHAHALYCWVGVVHYTPLCGRRTGIFLDRTVFVIAVAS